MEIIKNVSGIDISKDKFICNFGSMFQDLSKVYHKSEAFDNNLKGFKKLLEYVKKYQGTCKAPLTFVMEATGVYYENLAYFLAEKNQSVVVVLPNKTKNYSKSLEKKSKTDKLDARMLTQFGLERQLELWKLPSPIMKTLKSLTREHTRINEIIVMLRNQMHAQEFSHQPIKSTLKRNKGAISIFKKQAKEVQKELTQVVKTDPELQKKINNIKKVKGLGFITIVKVIAETNGFILIKNAKQLASYAGFDVVYNESGQKKHQTSISGKGNSHIRRALYMPALTACKHNQQLKQFYIRIIAKTKFKKIGAIAVARKLLLLIYTLFRKNEEYQPDYVNSKNKHPLALVL